MIATQADHRLTHSRLQCAKTCLRKHYLMYELGLRPDKEAPPLRVGRAFHIGMELMGQMGVEEAIASMEAVYYTASLAQGADAESLAIERQMVFCLLRNHLWRWGPMDAEIQVIASEQVFGIPLQNPMTGKRSRTWTLAGRRDKLVKLPGDRLAILEYKTTSEDISPESDFWRGVLLDSQVSLYWLAALDAGLKVETVLYDVTRKPDLSPRQVALLDECGNKKVLDAQGQRVLKKDGKPRQTSDSALGYVLQTRPETPEEFYHRLLTDIEARPDYYFARREIPRLQADLEEARYELWQWGKILRDCRRHGRWPRNTGACRGFGRCSCWDLCTGGFEPESGIIPAGWKQVENIHQELEE